MRRPSVRPIFSSRVPQKISLRFHSFLFFSFFFVDRAYDFTTLFDTRKKNAQNVPLAAGGPCPESGPRTST